MPDVTDSAWIWDGASRSKYFGKFGDKAAERFLAKNGGRIALGWYLAGDAALTVEPLDLFCSRLWSMGRLEIGIDKADRDAASEALCALECAYSWKQLQGGTFNAWLTTHTSGDIVSIAKALGRGNIWNLRKDIYEGYGGAGTPEDLQGMVKEFDKALYRGASL
jgi:hypothetical protein